MREAFQSPRSAVTSTPAALLVAKLEGRPRREPDAEGSVGVPATPVDMKNRAFPPKLPFGTNVTRSEFDSREVMQWTT